VADAAVWAIRAAVAYGLLKGQDQAGECGADSLSLSLRGRGFEVGVGRGLRCEDLSGVACRIALCRKLASHADWPAILSFLALQLE